MPINNLGSIGPTRGNPVPDAAHEHVATAQHGETVADVARRHGVQMKSLLEANPQLKDAHQTLNAGQEVRLPFDPVAKPQSTQLSAADVAQVQGGSATSIAHKHLAGVKYEDITSTPLDDPTTKGVIQGKLQANTANPTTLMAKEHKGGIELNDYGFGVTMPATTARSETSTGSMEYLIALADRLQSTDHSQTMTLLADALGKLKNSDRMEGLVEKLNAAASRIEEQGQGQSRDDRRKAGLDNIQKLLDIIHGMNPEI